LLLLLLLLLLLPWPESPAAEKALRAPLKTAAVHPLTPPRDPVPYCLKAESMPRPSAFHTRTTPLPSPVTSREPPPGFQSKKRTPPPLPAWAVSLAHTQSSLPPLLLLLPLLLSLVAFPKSPPLALLPDAPAAEGGVME